MIRTLRAAWRARGFLSAWAQAETALPVPGRICVQGRGPEAYEAWAQAAQEHGWLGLGFGYGRTPTEALRRLATKLRSDREAAR